MQNWNTEEGGNNFTVTFYEYEVSSKSISELEFMQEKVINKILNDLPEIKNWILLKSDLQSKAKRRKE